jgi:hypothetical protein
MTARQQFTDSGFTPGKKRAGSEAALFLFFIANHGQTKEKNERIYATTHH